ncbi:2TM domain-containing protein [Ascidiimonas aurantiaca]|uniref:2TM domain-containing protein n=1 Tax=Ascidiimonas aurantiaca TaxID=1685432 RepID=UPI0030ED9421
MNNSQYNEKYSLAKRKVDKLKGFYWHLLIYLVMNTVIVFLSGKYIEEAGGDFWEFGTFATAIFWGIGLVIHGLSVLSPLSRFEKSWEERKIREFMEKEEKEYQRSKSQ